LAGGTYSTQARATDILGARSVIVSGPPANVSDVEIATGNWQVHMSAGRLKVYQAPCRNVGFGACDIGFSEIFLANQFNPFDLHRRAPSSDWYVRGESIP
jgi:hypothetical protein